MKLTSGICAAAAVLLLAGCAYETPAPAVAVATPAGPAIVATTTPAGSTVYYDRFYGPVSTGYWGSDGLFHYQLTANGPWLVDSARHFRHDSANGFEVVTITPAAIPPG
jgi:hypothetical protein